MSLRNILLVVKDCSKTADFLVQVANMSIVHESKGFIELRPSSGNNSTMKSVPIILRVLLNLTILFIFGACVAVATSKHPAS